MIYKINISELFKTTPKSLPQKSPDDYNIKYKTTIKALCGGWFIENINAKLPPFKIRRLSKKEKIK